MQRGAELAVAFGCPVIVFDWATKGLLEAPLFFEVNTYRRSERALELSHVIFGKFIDQLLSTMPDTKLHLIGHSMGNRIIIDYLEKRSGRESSKQLGEVHLVRSDSSLAAYLMEQWEIFKRVDRAYIYTANNDWWLRWSERLGAGIPRLGRPGKIKWMTTTNDLEEGPSNRYLIDISRFTVLSKFNHQIPFELIGQLHKNKEPDKLDDWKLRQVEPNNRYPRVLSLERPGAVHFKD
jgi:pimeloyl-ACP methyl ester carboxylesterase